MICLRSTVFTALFLLLSFSGCCHAWSTSTSPSTGSSSSSNSRTTISVCTGPDCRVDGGSDCLRRIQKSIAASQLKANICVTGRSCVGPCGDGPCVTIEDANNKKVIVKQSSKEQIALVPPDMFGSNPKGWYQVRTEQQLEQVLHIAAQVADVDYEKQTSASTRVFVNSTRAWYDRPRNERKVLQRLAQAFVFIGLAKYDGQVGNLQYAIAAGIFFLSDFIMKENLWVFLLEKIRK